MSSFKKNNSKFIKKEDKEENSTSIFKSPLMKSFKFDDQTENFNSTLKEPQSEVIKPDPVFSFSQGLSINFNVLN